MNQTDHRAETPEPYHTFPYVVMYPDFRLGDVFSSISEALLYASLHGGCAYRLVPVVVDKEAPRQHESTCVYYELGSCNCGAI